MKDRISVYKGVITLDIKYTVYNGIGIPYAYVVGNVPPHTAKIDLSGGELNGKYATYKIHRTFDDAYNDLLSYTNKDEYDKVRVICPDVRVIYSFIHNYISGIEVNCNKENLTSFNTRDFDFCGIRQIEECWVNELVDKYPNIGITYVNPIDYPVSPNTPLTSELEEYILCDTKIMCKYGEIKRIKKHGMMNVKGTKSTELKNRLLEYLLHTDDYKIFWKYEDKSHSHRTYKSEILDATVTKQLCEMVKRASTGGFIGINTYMMNERFDNVGSADITSAHPFQMITKHFPMPSMYSNGFCYFKGKDVTIGELMNDNICDSLINVHFHNLNLKDGGIPIIDYKQCSKSPCEFSDWVANSSDIKDLQRYVKSSKDIDVTCTSILLKAIDRYYTYDKSNSYVIDGYKARANTINPALKKSILEDFCGKYKAKAEGNAKEEAEYKLKINRIYGWHLMNPLDYNRSIEDYNTNPYRFSLPTGVFINDYTKVSICELAEEIGEDVICVNTDCVKYLNPEMHKDAIDRYNEKAKREISNFIDNNRWIEEFPEIKQELVKNLGGLKVDLYDSLYCCTTHKYCYSMDDELHIVWGGVPKEDVINFIKSLDREDWFNPISYRNLHPTHKHRATRFFPKDSKVGTMVDYLGNTYDYDVCGYCC